MTLEESRKRMEASLARKRVNVGLANGAGPGADAPASPATSGAMDSLLEKLRAAAPHARDQRDRRRRARLKERHQVREASGQKMPDNLMSGEGEGSELENGANGADTGPEANPETGLLPPSQESESGSQVSEGEDVADRAASMLQGLRGSSEGSGERLRRRRESAEEERRNRRLRRRNGAGWSKDYTEGAGLSSVSEPSLTEPDITAENVDEQNEEAQQAPSIVVSSTADQHDTPDSEPREDTPRARSAELSD